jgi:uncharacterized protein YjeT (DUF2065 family)
MSDDADYWRKVDAEDAAHLTEQRVWRTGVLAFFVGCCVGWLIARLLSH